MASKNENPSLDISRVLIELRNAFLAELPARLETIESLILELNRTPYFSENYETLFRHVHSLKGSAGTHGLHIVTTVCHALEDEIVTVEGNQAMVTGDLVSAWLGYIDLLRSTIEDFHAGREDFSAVEVSLADLGSCTSLDAAAVGAVFESADELTLFQDGEVVYEVWVRPVLPGRTCES